MWSLRATATVVDAVGPDALVTLGNVDVASIWIDVVGAELPYLDAQTVDIAGRRLGFVAGGAAKPGVPFRPPDQVWQTVDPVRRRFRAAVKAVGPVDILCSHVPPNLANCGTTSCRGGWRCTGQACWSPSMSTGPALAVFGHVHQPISRRTRRGHTECVNVGHFQRFPRPFEVVLR